MEHQGDAVHGRAVLPAGDRRGVAGRSCRPYPADRQPDDGGVLVATASTASATSWPAGPFTGLEAFLFAINVLAAIGFALLVPQILARTDSSANAVGAGADHRRGRRRRRRRAAGAATGHPAQDPPDARRPSWSSASSAGSSTASATRSSSAGVALLFLHLSIPFIDGYAQSVWQEKVEPAHQGRVFAARQFIEDLAVPVATSSPVRSLEPVVGPLDAAQALGGDLFGGLVGTGPGRHRAGLRGDRRASKHATERRGT